MRNEKGEEAPPRPPASTRRRRDALVSRQSRASRRRAEPRASPRRTTRKVYWAIVAGVPKTAPRAASRPTSPRRCCPTATARRDSFLAPAGRHAVRPTGARRGGARSTRSPLLRRSWRASATEARLGVAEAGHRRTHQLRVHAASIGHPIIGDPKYFNIENWELPGGIQSRLHLLARRIVVPHPRTGKPIDVTAPLPPHMQQTFNLLGLETDAYDPIVEAPEA